MTVLEFLQYGYKDIFSDAKDPELRINAYSYDDDTCFFVADDDWSFWGSADEYAQEVENDWGTLPWCGDVDINPKEFSKCINFRTTKYGDDVLEINYYRKDNWSYFAHPIDTDTTYSACFWPIKVI